MTLTDKKLPEYHGFEDFQKRQAKLQEIRTLGINPYPYRFEQTHKSAELSAKYQDKTPGEFDDAEQGKTPRVALAGRLVLFRSMGKNVFGHLQDEEGRIQILFNRDHTAVEGLSGGALSPIKFIEKKLDLGDILGIEGHLFRTHKGELTVYVKQVTLLAKALLPLPDKHSGLQDKGVKYRKRWLDLITDQGVISHFRMRAQVVNGVRDYFQKLGFLEVETPILQNIYGGAEARPFLTHLNALSQEMYLRIALEIALKKLIVGGLGRVFEIGRIFRNEGIDKTHNPEFTMVEAYAAYLDYNDIMGLVENLFAAIATSLFGSTKIGPRSDKQGQTHEIDLQTPWKRLTMKEAIKTYGKIDVDTLSNSALTDTVRPYTTPEEVPTLTRGKKIAILFENCVESHLIQPHHITDHPIETTPLCKIHRRPKEQKEQLVERFESFILGIEFANCYSELNDPEVQRTLLEAQAALREKGHAEASPMDEDFLEALCQGMPPTGGLGIGIDRLTMLFTGVTSIRDILFFPLMRPEG